MRGLEGGQHGYYMRSRSESEPYETSNTPGQARLNASAPGPGGERGVHGSWCLITGEREIVEWPERDEGGMSWDSHNGTGPLVRGCCPSATG